MPLSHHLYEQDQILLTTWAGQISDSEMIRFYMSLYNNGHWKPGFDEVMDLRDAELGDLSSEALKQLAELAAQSHNGQAVKLALIAPSNLSSDIARIYESFTHVPNESIKLFHHLSEATEWLSQTD